MEQPQQRSKSMVFVLVVSAILLAVATFLTILLITSRSTPPGTTGVTPIVERQPTTINVNGVLITINIDPNKALLPLEDEIDTPPPEETTTETTTTETETSTTETETNTENTQPDVQRPDPIIFIDYTVMQGDTLYSIALAQNSSVALMARYGFDANDLTPGNVLRGLPVANPEYCPGSRAYVVRDNDTVFRIAAEFGTTVDAIAQLNQLDANYHIDMTQVICIPA